MGARRRGLSPASGHGLEGRAWADRSIRLALGLLGFGLLALAGVSGVAGAADEPDAGAPPLPGRDASYMNRAMGIGELRAPEPFTREQRLLHAVRTNDRATVERALELGVDVDTADDLGRNAFLLAIRDAQDLELAKLLAAHGAAIDAADAGGRTALSWAAARGRSDLVAFLLERGAVVDATDQQGRTPLFYAAIGDHGAMVERLATQGAELDVQDRRQETPLIAACAKAAGEAAATLVGLGADVTFRDQRGRTHADRNRADLPACRSDAEAPLRSTP